MECLFFYKVFLPEAENQVKRYFGMNISKKALSRNRFGFSNSKKKFGINYWRFIFSGVNAVTSQEQMFFVEFSMVNPWNSPSETLLGFKPRIKITQEDLQYALAGTESAKNLQTESIVVPSYCSVKMGMMGENAKQLCSYFPVKSIKFKQKPFEIEIGNKYFSETKISGFLNTSAEENNEHPEYFGNAGYATWNLEYEVLSSFADGYKDKTSFWFPFGLQCTFSGKINFDGTDYIVDPRRSLGFIERYWGKTLPQPWFHISALNLSSLITGKTLLDSAFAVKGAFNGELSFVSNIQGRTISFTADKAKKTFTSIWNCIQAPETENVEDNKLHWSVSLNSRDWIIDIDLYCKIKDLFNRTIELPDGNRKIMNILEGAAGIGEIKLFRKIKDTLEQIEHAKIIKAVCEFGQQEEGEI